MVRVTVTKDLFEEYPKRLSDGQSPSDVKLYKSAGKKTNEIKDRRTLGGGINPYDTESSSAPYQRTDNYEPV